MDSLVARFLSSGHCSTTRVKENAFHPPSDGALSVFVIDGLPSDEDVHAIGRTHVSKPDKRCKGYAEIGIVNFTQQKLSFARDDNPERHGTVKGWPIEKDFMKSIAQQLAAEAVLHYAPHKYLDQLGAS